MKIKKNIILNALILKHSKLSIISKYDDFYDLLLLAVFLDSKIYWKFLNPKLKR